MIKSIYFLKIYQKHLLKRHLSVVHHRLLLLQDLIVLAAVRAMSYSTLAALLLGAYVAHGGAVLPRQSNGSISTLSPAQIDTFTPYTWFTSTASCVPSATLTWSCGGLSLYCPNATRFPILTRYHASSQLRRESGV